MDTERRNDTETSAPRHPVTANQVVAWNIAWLRREAGMTQQDLAGLLGWPQNKVSEAERSWNGKRTREFDAETVVALAVALGVPVNAFFLPPVDDGDEVSYVIRPPGSDEDLDMGGLLAISITDTDEDTEVMASYRRRLLAAVGRYLGEDWEREVAGWPRRIFGREALKEGAFRFRGLVESLSACLGIVRPFSEALDQAADEDGDDQ
jgi:transcriptional regulator with XRE-family HTH domain